jgi:hypothetical protein
VKKTLDVLPDYSQEAIIEEIKRIANVTNKNTVTKKDLKQFGRVSYQTLLRRFPGGLSTVLQKAGLNYKPDNRFQPDQVLLKELQRIWEIVLQNEGRRPFQTDLKKYNCKFSISTYKDRFGSWLKACQKLLDWEEGELEFTETSSQCTTTRGGGLNYCT